MFNEKFGHKVNLSDRRRENKHKSDLLNRNVDGDMLQTVYNQYYKEQVRALYKVVCQDR
ncbi:MAG: hypothetical protein PHT95_06740 [Candidatus Omnitrophica bacterium]|nr:hypothetical protein [Candidatus Omnitrophota bacterium]